MCKQKNLQLTGMISSMGHDAGIAAGNTWRTGEPVLLDLSREDWGNISLQFNVTM